MAFSTGTIAQGCFGKVYKEKYNDTWAAVKKVPQHLISRKDLERECEVYNKANHPNIVKLLGNITLRDGKWVIPLEFIFGEDLETTIFKASKSKIQLTAAAKGTIIVGMCEGLLLLHSKDIVHQDLKPENIMVEHNTNRAVIIDLGLAKFFKRGLNSAMDMGNEAYSAPEVLQRYSQRSQRSDVWAMGKIIAELCARIRLYTPSVCPEKIKEVLKDQPYCSTVCRMVEQDPTMRASMGGVISDLRRAADSVANVPIQKEHLKPPVPQINARSPSPSPLNRDPSPGIRDKSPGNLGVSPGIRDISPGNRGVSPGIRDISPGNRGVSPGIRDISPGNRGVSPGVRDISPGNRGAFPLNNDPFPLNKFGKNQSPPDRPPGAIFERLPRPEMKALPRAGLLLASPPKRQEDRNRIQDLAPKGGTEIAQDLMKMKLLNEAAKDLPCNLPATGRVVVRRFEEKNGQMGTWEQTEVVTRDGKIVKYDDVKFNSR